ncbi:hypothetical protein BC628DRAFT_1412046 [Trametes gibbosa]|nr:hypothetical protein BC628DRAFT_1412046 [Trametes gibbosa]
MGQCWLIIDFDRRETLGGGKMCEFFWDGAQDIMNALRVPAPFDAKIDELLRGTISNQQASPLCRLSQELFDLIFDELEYLDYYQSFGILAISCRAVLSHARNRLVARIGALHSHALAGHRLICLGEYAGGPSKLPAEILGADELNKLRTHAEAFGLSLNLYEYALENFKDSDVLLTYSSYPMPFMAFQWSSKDFALCKSISRPNYPLDRPWVLRNLSNHEYVREDAAKALCESLPANPHEDIDLGRPKFSHFLLVNICWSRVTSTAGCASEGGDLSQGHWAGDRFDIVLMDILTAEDEEGSWKDVTDEVGEVIKQMWEAEVEALS